MVGEAEDQQDQSRQDEEGGDYGVAGDSIGPWRGGFAVAEDEDGGGGEGVKEPFGKDGEREEGLKLSDDEQQQRA